MSNRTAAIEQAAVILFNEDARRYGLQRDWSRAPEEERRAWRTLAALPSAPPRFQIPPALKVIA